MDLADRTADRFDTLLGRTPTLLAHAPGRVNVIGEHTDYNGGYVLPAALGLGTVVAARRRFDGRLRTLALRRDDVDNAEMGEEPDEDTPDWARYVRGMASLLYEEDLAPPGADLVIDGDLPLSSGLSSSASLEIAVGTALLGLAGEELEPAQLARFGQRVEHEIVGVRCGIMDQLASAAGREGHLLQIDCRSLAVQAIPFPDDLRLLVVDSGVPRDLASSAYNERRAECEAAVVKLQGLRGGLISLRDADPELLEAARGDLSPVEMKRARHVVTENERVQRTAAALRAGDGRLAGRLLKESHDSLRDDYEVSGKELDLLVDISMEQAGVLGARLTGAGFGGCVVALVMAVVAERERDAIVRWYRRSTGRDAAAYVCTPGPGATIL
jgi:galactokinase